MGRVTLLNVTIDNVSPQEAISVCDRLLTDGQQHLVVTPNPEFLVAAQHNPEFRTILNHASLAVADGVGLQWAARITGQQLQRVTGVDLMVCLCEHASQKNYSVYLLGAAEGVAQKTAEELKKHFPNLSIAGAESGGVITEQHNTIRDATIEQINNVKPDILFVALGQIKQEKWIYRNLDKLPSVKIAIGVGGSFDYISGVVPRAPQWLRSIGLEWLYRLIKQPSRWRRIMDATLVFPWLIIKSKFSSH